MVDMHIHKVSLYIKPIFQKFLYYTNTVEAKSKHLVNIDCVYLCIIQTAIKFFCLLVGQSATVVAQDKI